MVVAEKRAGGAGATNIVDEFLILWVKIITNSSIGLKNLKTLSQQTSLVELGMDSMMAVEIKQTLEREFEVFLTAQDIRGLNFAKLVQMSTQEAETEKKIAASKGKETEIIGRMRLLLRVLGTGDLSPEECLKLTSKNEPGRNEVFLIPGIEGYGSVFKPLAEKIKSPAICLQLVACEKMEMSVVEMAKQLLPHVLARSKDRKDFVLVGYSFGSLVTIELARLLEGKGFTGRIVLIDGSPELLKEIKNQQLPFNNNSELQTNFLLGVMDMIAPTLSGELLVQVEKCANWTQKLEALISRLPPGILMITPEQQKSIFTAVYNRLLAIQSYNYAALPPIRSPIILLKPTQLVLRSTSEDYGLRRMTRDKVEIYTVEGNHVSMLEENKVAAAINGKPLEDAVI